MLIKHKRIKKQIYDAFFAEVNKITLLAVFRYTLFLTEDQS